MPRIAHATHWTDDCVLYTAVVMAARTCILPVLKAKIGRQSGIALGAGCMRQAKRAVS